MHRERDRNRSPDSCTAAGYDDGALFVIRDVEPAAEVRVRINPINGRGEGDVEGVATVDGVDALVVPLVDGAEEISAAAEAFDAVGATDVDLVPVIETPQPTLVVDDVACVPGVAGTIVGAEDSPANGR